MKKLNLKPNLIQPIMRLKTKLQKNKCVKSYSSGFAFGWRQIISVAALMVMAVAGFLLLARSAQMQNDVNADERFVSNSAGQADALGKLAFSRTTFVFAGAFNTLFTANPDGSAQTGLTQFPPFAPTEPAWSPDGSKIAFADSLDIFVVNADGSSPVNLTNTMFSVQERNPAWSVTGKIAYERGGQIWMMNSDGSNQTPFPGISQPAATAPAWSFDGSKLAFVSGGDVFVINADGTNQRRVTTSAAAENNPAFSPDGAKIVFQKGVSGIFVINVDGTNEIALTNGDDREPAWSHDGTKIAFVRKGTSVNGIYLMNPDGTSQVRIIADFQDSRGYENNSPAWQPVAVAPNTFSITGRITRVGASLGGVTVNLSGTVTVSTVTDANGNYQFSNLPAGGNYTVTPVLSNHVFTPSSRTFNNLNTNQVADFTATEICQGANCVTNGKIAFVRDGEIYTMNPDGSNQTNITNNSATDDEPAWSPDGNKIVFSSNRAGNFEIYLMNQDGGSVVRLTDNSAADTAPTFSPDGSKIAFVSERDGNKEIYVMNADGSNPTRLTNEPARDDFPSYSPDGSKIVFITQRSNFGQGMIFTMNADGSNQARLSNQNGFHTRPSYSPDGSKIIYGYGADVTAQTIYRMNADGTNPMQMPIIGRESASYSPDGSKIVFACCFGFPNSPNGIYIANADGTQSSRITTGTFDNRPKWQPLRNAVLRPLLFDFDGDRKADISVFRPSNSIWYLLGSTAGFGGFSFGAATDKITPADFDGDGKTDIAVWRPAPADVAKFYILNSTNNTVREELFAQTGDIPLAADWDGDGRADITVYRNGANGGQSYFFYRPSLQPGVNFVSVPWGITGDKPILGDFDADGRNDAAVFRPSSGAWFVRYSSNSQFYAVQFGAAEDIPAPADFDGDGKTDVSVFRPSIGTWYRINSQNNSFFGVQWGASGDIPTAADYDGDGKADVSIFRPSNGGWYRINSSNGQVPPAIQFGAAGDIPIPAAFAQ